MTIRFPTLLGLAAYVVGAWWRFWYIFYAHPPTDYLEYDMASYVYLAKRWLRLSHTPDISEALWPPGTPLYLGLTYSFDPTWLSTLTAQWLVSSLTPLVLTLIAYHLYGHRAAILTLIMASLYFPFIKYAGFFLSETPFLFCLAISVWLFMKSFRSQQPLSAFSLALCSGLSFGIASSFKTGGLISAVMVGCGVIAFGWKHRLHRIGVLVAGGLIGLLMVLGPLTYRCTTLSDGQVCLVANQMYNVLLGHYGEIRSAMWHDPKRETTRAVALASGRAHRYHETANFEFGCYDTASNLAEAWRWIRQYPWEALFLSVQHVFDLFAIHRLWPDDVRIQQRVEEVFQWLFWVLVLLPVISYLGSNRRALVRLEADAFEDVLLLLPLIGLMIGVFFSVGEIRYRIPYDGLLMILAARSWVGTER